MPDLPTPERLPCPHARNDCQACRERDADLRMLPDPDCTDPYQPARQHDLVLCARCFGTHLAYQAVHNSGPHFDQPTTVTVALVAGQQVAVLTAAGPAPYPPATYWPAAAGLAYPHRHNDCHSCQERDADLVLVDPEPRSAMCGHCAGWSLALRLAADPSGTDPRRVRVLFAPSRWQGAL
jgi:hypothetical protein